MNYRSENIPLAQHHRRAFTIIEVVAATTIIGILASSVLVVFIRCSEAVRDSTRRTQALEVARENMETLLGADSISEQVVYGYSDKYPAIQWTNTVESFYEPVKEKMWLRAVCSAQYQDSNGELKKVELTHWLTRLTDKQIKQILDARELLKEKAAEPGLSGPEGLYPGQTPPDQDAGPDAPRVLPPPPDDLSNMTPEEIERWINQVKNN